VDAASSLIVLALLLGQVHFSLNKWSPG
jgi:3-hydroxyacyl-CoA dehydrogenase